MKTILILVDGMRPDALTDLKIAQDTAKRARTTMSAQTVLPSSTLPAHMSLFHSVLPERHGTITNDYAPQVRPISGLCEVLKKQKKKSAFFYAWEQLRDLTRPGTLAYAKFVKGGAFGYDVANPILTEDAIRILHETDIDFLFLYLGYPDAVGHDKGWMSEEYMKSVKESWDCIDRVLGNLPADCSVIITADHGGHGRSHGTEAHEDMTIPIMLLGDGIDPALPIENATILDIAPTVTHLLSVEPDSDWEGKSLL